MNDIGNKIKNRRNELKLSQEELASRTGYTDRSSIAKIEQGKVKLYQDKIELFAKALNVSPMYLMGWESSDGKATLPPYPNISPIATQKLPVLGKIACGEPIFMDEEREFYTVEGVEIHADFILIASGDSMINARIYDGDMVFIREQPKVENGEIAAVAIDDEATLKRVYYNEDTGTLSLVAENPAYEPMVFTKDSDKNVRIMGKAVAFQSDVM